MQEATPLQNWWTNVVITPECWEWRGYINNRGYGFHKGQFTHRLAYELFVGPIPEGLYIDHLCRNRACCRPDHLEPVTPRENVMRGIGPTAKNAVKTHCKNGHELVGDNICRDKRSGGRNCRKCNVDRSLAYKRAKAAAKRAGAA